MDDASSARANSFGANTLKVKGKIFAMPMRGALVVKLPRQRAATLVDSGAAAFFDPGQGRLMKEWVALAGPAEQ